MELRKKCGTKLILTGLKRTSQRNRSTKLNGKPRGKPPKNGCEKVKVRSIFGQKKEAKALNE